MNEPIGVGERTVHGRVTDAQTRCVHYGGPLDILALLFPCCGRWYPCHLCHDEDAEHAVMRWRLDERWREAVLCGKCGRTARIDDYLASSLSCAGCDAAFNPGCRLHHHLYFE